MTRTVSVPFQHQETGVWCTETEQYEYDIEEADAE